MSIPAGDIGDTLTDWAIDFFDLSTATLLESGYTVDELKHQIDQLAIEHSPDEKGTH